MPQQKSHRKQQPRQEHPCQPGLESKIKPQSEFHEFMNSQLNEHTDTDYTKKIIEEKGRQYLALVGEIANANFCKQVIGDVKEFGSQMPKTRQVSQKKIASGYVFLASEDAAYMFGQVLHPKKSVIVNGSRWISYFFKN